MLEQLGKHGGFDLRIDATGDLDVDLHHTVEDVGIVLGTALKEALGDKAGVRRFASSLVPLDEALVQVALDLSGRPFLVYEVDPVAEWIGTFDPQLAEEFWRAFAFGSRDHAAHPFALGAQRSPRDRGLVQGRGPGAARRGEGRGHGRAVDQGHALSPTAGRAATPRSTCATATACGCTRATSTPRPSTTTTRSGSRASSRPPARSGSTSSTSMPPAPATRAHLDQIRLIVRSVACRIEVGGGVRTAESARELLDAGVERVVIGTAAVERPALVEELCRELPGTHRGGPRRPGQRGRHPRVEEGSGADLVDLARRFDGIGLAALVVTEIGRDGTLEGPAFGQLGRGPGRRRRSR